MFRKSVLIALASVALLGLGPVSAQAEIGSFTASTYPATVTATQVGENVFKFGGSWQVSCGEASLSGTLWSKANGVQMNQSYAKCTANGIRPVTVRTNGCVYAWKLEELEGLGTAKGWTSGSCGGGKTLEFDIYEGAASHSAGFPLCTYGIPPQVETTMQTHNGESGGIEDVQLTLSLTGFEVKVLKGSKLLCGAGVGEAVSGSYTGTQTLSATNEGKAVSLMVG